MKNTIFLLCAVFLISLTSCSDEEPNTDQVINSSLVGTWNATNTSGGFAGISCDYNPGELLLTFDNEDNLIVTNNIMHNALVCGGQEIGISVGNHKYGILENDDRLYLLVDDIERGELSINDNEITINQNSGVDGGGADLFFLIFTK